MDSVVNNGSVIISSNISEVIMVNISEGNGTKCGDILLANTRRLKQKAWEFRAGLHSEA